MGAPVGPPAARHRWGAAPLVLVLLLSAQSACGGAGPLDQILDRGETLRIHAAQPNTLDPALAADSVSWTYLLQIFSGLVRLDQQLEVVPDLAERWDVSPDGRTYTFHLRPGIKFHSGRDLKTSDFKYAMERALDPATRSPVAKQYLGDVVGASDVIAGATRDVRGIRVLDDRTLAIEIDAPKTYFLAKLTYPTAYALDRANVDSGLSWWERPNGTGPFRLVEWLREEKLTLARFSQHWSGAARVKSLEFNLSAIPGIVLYERGDVDVAPLDLSSLDRVSDPANPLSRELVTTQLLSTWYLGMNPSVPPFDDTLVRQAFAFATDRDRMTRVYFRGTRASADSILPPGLPGFRPGIHAPVLDLARARGLLASSRYAGRMPEVTLSVGPGSGATGEALAEMYARNLGIDVAVRELGDDFFASLEGRRAQFFFTGWIADYPHPEDFLDILFHSNSQGNYGGYANAELDALLVRARVAQEDNVRGELYERAERLILSDAAAIPVHHEAARVLIRSYVKNLVWTPLGVLSYHDVEVGERTVRRAA